MLRHVRASLIIGLGIASSSVLAQTVGINATGAAANASAMLDIDVSSLPANNKKGLLIPRMTEAQRIAIPAPSNGLSLYQPTDAVGNYAFDDLPSGVYYVRQNARAAATQVAPVEPLKEAR